MRDSLVDDKTVIDTFVEVKLKIIVSYEFCYFKKTV